MQKAWDAEGLEASHEVAEFFGISHKKEIMPPLFGALMGKNLAPRSMPPRSCSEKTARARAFSIRSNF